MRLAILKVTEIDRKAPDFIQIVPLGDMKDGQGNPFRVTPEVVKEIIKAFSKRINDLVVDYEHQTLDGVEAPAAGWIVDLEDRGEFGLWAKVNWTERGKQFVESKEYRYLSPVLFVKKVKGGPDIPFRLHSAALTNDPAIDGMVPLINKNSSKESVMDFLKKMKKLLGLDDAATEDQVEAQVAAMKQRVDAGDPEPRTVEVLPGAVCAALDLKTDASASEVEASILALKQTTTTVESQRVQKLENQLAEMKAEGVVDSALKDGKLTADQKDWALAYAKRDLNGFNTFVAKAPKVVPTGEIPPGPGKEEPGKFADETLAIAKMFDNTKEDLVTFGGLKEN